MKFRRPDLASNPGSCGEKSKHTIHYTMTHYFTIYFHISIFYGPNVHFLLLEFLTDIITTGL